MSSEIAAGLRGHLCKRHCKFNYAHCNGINDGCNDSVLCDIFVLPDDSIDNRNKERLNGMSVVLHEHLSRMPTCKMRR